MSLYTYNPDAARRALTYQRQQDEKAELRAMYEVPRIQTKIAAEIAKEIAARKAKDGNERSTELDSIVYNPVSDSYVRVNEADDSTPTASFFDAKAHAAARRFSDAEADYSAVCEEETGMSVSPEEWERQKMERAEVRRQSHYLAHILENQGTRAYRDDAFQLWIWHVHSKVAESIPNFRRICFLPYIAAIVRSTKLAALEYFIDRHPFCRFWTFTSGQRVGIDGLRARIEELHTNLNALNKELRRLYGVELVFRSTELGSVEFDAANRPAADSGSIEYDENGNPLFHVHAHCVVHSLVGYIPKKRWVEMVNFVHSHWEHHWDAGEIIRNARECCKYVTKPADMVKLGEKSPAALAAVETALHGLRLVTPLGTLRREIRARKEAGNCLRRKRTHDGMVWREVPDHNKHAEQDKADQEERFRLAGAELKDRIDCKGAEGVDSPIRWALDTENGAAGMRKKSDAWICKVMARLAPAVGPRGLKEPRVIVGGTHLDVKTVMNHPLVSRLWAQTVEAWHAGLSISVHTGTPTGEAVAMPFLADLPERMKPASEPVWEALEPAEYGAN